MFILGGLKNSDEKARNKLRWTNMGGHEKCDVTVPLEVFLPTNTLKQSIEELH